MVRPGKKQKNPPIFSQEFIIQNHADIVSCIAMVFVGGLMIKATSPLASMFITMHHNITINETVGESTATKKFYQCGIKDVFASFFYLLICIVVHAVIQEYILDKVNRRLHLSKTKHSKFNESGQLLVFYSLSAVWGADLLVRENFVPGLSSMWVGYPHSMSFLLKFYFIIQISYWLHLYPELYLQKVKREEVSGRVRYITLYLVFITVAYSLNFHRVTLVLLVLHYLVEAVFHGARIFYFADKMDLAKPLFMLWNGLFIAVRLITVIIAFLTFWAGLVKSNQDSIEVASRNFNTSLIRINCLVAVVLVQGWLMWNFITFQVRRARDRASAASTVRRPRQPKQNRKKAAKHSDADTDSEEANENGVRRRNTPRSQKR